MSASTLQRPCKLPLTDILGARYRSIELTTVQHAQQDTRQKRKRVKFHSACKSHDGLRRESEVFEQLMFLYFSSSFIRNSGGMYRLRDYWQTLPNDRLHFVNDQELAKCLFKCIPLLERLFRKLENRQPSAKVPVLCFGGGRGLQIQHAHMPHLQQLLMYMEAFCINTLKHVR
ncbi:hypothetical protein OAM67_00535 [bacterium]|nr:hypothetical protein [bacterium]